MASPVCRPRGRSTGRSPMRPPPSCATGPGAEMSFILDALKKSETDRQRQSSPALFEVKVAAPRRKFPVWAAGLAVLLGINFLVLAWVLLRRPETPVIGSPVGQNLAQPMAANSAPPGMVTV